MENFHENTSVTPIERKEGGGRNLKNRLLLAMALGVGLMAADASADQIRENFGANARAVKGIAAERAKPAAAEDIATVGLEYSRLTEQLESVKAEYGLIKARVVFKVRQVAGPGVISRTIHLEQFMPGPKTPEDIRRLIRQQADAADRLAALELAAH